MLRLLVRELLLGLVERDGRLVVSALVLDERLVRLLLFRHGLVDGLLCLEFSLIK